MAYIGNDVRSNEDYKIIDDISSGFNGSTTSFALQVGGATPVPFPKFEQQLLISVNGVIQEPDPTGSAGFKLLGTNIVFSSAPTNGHAFFGVIYAGADYVNAGGTFPDGSINFPSITFSEDTNTGFTRTASGTISVISDGTKVAQFPTSQGSNGQVLVTDGGGTLSYSSTITSPIVSGDLTIPDKIVHTGDTNTAIRFPAADTFSVETAGTEKLRVDSGGHISIGTATSRAIGGSVERKLQVEATSADAGVAITRNSANAVGPFLSFGKSRSSSVGGTTVVQSGDQLGQINFSGADGSDIVSNAASIRALVDGTPGSNDMPGRLEFSTTADGAASPTARMTIKADGNVGIGTAIPSVPSGTALEISGSSVSRLKLSNSTTGTGSTDGFQIYTSGNTAILENKENAEMRFYTNASERLRLDSSGKVGIGTTSPDTRLHVHKASAGSASSDNNSVLTLENNNHCILQMLSPAASSNRIMFGDPDATNSGEINYDHNINTLLIKTNGSEQIRVDSSGNVGIGLTSSPVSSNSEQGVFLAGADTTQSVIASNSTPLVINRVGTGGNDRNCLELRNNGTLRGNIGAIGAANGMYFETGTSEAMRIDSSGRVGIGTSSPSTPLHVSTNTDGTSDLLTLHADADGQNANNGIASIKFMGNSNHAAFIKGGHTANGDTILTFHTDAHDSGINPEERMRIESDGNVRITSQHLRFDTTGKGIIFGIEGGSDRPSIVGNYTSSTNNNIAFNTTGSERMRIDMAGRLLIGHSVSQTIGSNSHPLVQLNVNSNQQVLTLARFENSSAGPGMVLGKSRASSAGNYTVVQNGDGLGTITFSGADGTDLISRGAAIEAQVDGTPGNNDMPGRLVFMTTADDSDSPTERMRIDSSGVLSIGTTSPNGSASKLQVEDSGENNVYFVGNTTTSGARLILQNKNTTANSFTGVLGADGGGQTTASINFYSADNDTNEGYLTLETRPASGIPTEALRIDSSGNVGLGVTSVSDARFRIKGANNTTTAFNDGLMVTSNNETVYKKYSWMGIEAKGGMVFSETNSGSLVETMRIDTSGRVFVGTTTTTPHNDGSGILIHPTQGVIVGVKDTHAGIFARHDSDGECIRFQRATADVGSIDVSSSSTSYNTSSDYRLKENVVAISDGITRLKTLKPSRFNFKVDKDTTVDGFLAHEVTAVPEAITGTKDEVVTQAMIDAGEYEEGTLNDPIYQGIDQSKLVPLLVAAVQELITKVETLEAA